MSDVRHNYRLIAKALVEKMWKECYNVMVIQLCVWDENAGMSQRNVKVLSTYVQWTQKNYIMVYKLVNKISRIKPK